MKFLKTIFSPAFAGFYMLVFAAAIGLATFIENDFGTQTAQKVIFSATWFEILLFLFSGSIIYNMIKFKMFRVEKWPSLLFHIAMLVILVGAGITRYTGYEGTMRIREGKSANFLYSRAPYLTTVILKDKNALKFENELSVGSLGTNNFKARLQAGDSEEDIMTVKMVDFVPNATKKVVDDPNGSPLLHLVIAGGMEGRTDLFVKKGEALPVQGQIVAFSEQKAPSQPSINIYQSGDSLLIDSPARIERMTMGSMVRDTLDAGVHKFSGGTLYVINHLSIVMKEFYEKGNVVLESTSPKLEASSKNAYVFDVEAHGETKNVTVMGNMGMPGEEQLFQVGNYHCKMSYGSRYIDLPFELYLKDFQLERYPGSDSPASYASEVVLIDTKEDLEEDHRIFMNHVLDYKGYRFFQSSYDEDEMGTILSVNYDYWGTLVTYLGYALLTLGLLVIFFKRGSRFTFLIRKLDQMKDKTFLLLFVFMALGWGVQAQEATTSPELPIIDLDHATKFESIVTLDYKGRVKPLNTVASETLRKIARKGSYEGQTAMQVFIGMTVFPDDWKKQNLIAVKHPALAAMLDRKGEEYVTYYDFFDKETGSYLLETSVAEAHRTKSAERSKMDDELIKVDERVNICQLIFSGRLWRIFPKRDTTDHNWLTPVDGLHETLESGEAVDEFTQKFFPSYLTLAENAARNGGWDEVNELVSILDSYQHRYGVEIMPSRTKVMAEIKMNKWRVFTKLGITYGLVGFILLILSIMRLLMPEFKFRWVMPIGKFILIMGFLVHTAGLLTRWFVSGHAPWSNGYETMIYIAWASMLSALFFVRRSTLAFATTAILASIILAVSGLSWLDPEITPLVPVLNSYWLNIHVSMIVASYGFLGMGSLLGFVSLLLGILNFNGKKQAPKDAIKQLTYINELTLTIGLVLLSIGTHLGGVWANESWGRYWGWDPKETWALVTILIYAFVLHIRLIPKVRTAYTFNLFSVVSLASVIMTYFGVNYYLSGLHSYAAGDPLPIPSFVYYCSALVVIVALAAWKSKGFPKTA